MVPEKQLGQLIAHWRSVGWEGPLSCRQETFPELAFLERTLYNELISQRVFNATHQSLPPPHRELITPEDTHMAGSKNSTCVSALTATPILSLQVIFL